LGHKRGNTAQIVSRVFQGNDQMLIFNDYGPFAEDQDDFDFGTSFRRLSFWNKIKLLIGLMKKGMLIPLLRVIFSGRFNW
jgi:hypothetical protein